MAKEDPSRQSSDLLFAWLSPIETKVDRRLHPKSTSVNIPASSPLVTKARSALRKTLTVKSPHVNSFNRSARKTKVKEANDACLWLKAAGFPQYVQMYKDGLFPINLSKFQVEKDHTFLDQPDIDSLIRRLNTLNRCADIMDSIPNSKGDDSEDETSFRALSDKWQFRRKQKRWLRRKESKNLARQESLFSSNEDLLDDGMGEEATPTDHSPLMLVSELRKSLTGLDRAVKTYSFMVGEEQVPMIHVDPPKVPNNRTLFQQMSSNYSSFESDEDTGSWDTEMYPTGGMDNFAMGIIDTFESNLLKLKEFQTQSLPDVFKASKGYRDDDDDDDSLDSSPLSSTSVSTTSILDSSDLLEASRASPNEESRADVGPLTPRRINGCTALSDDRGGGGGRDEFNHTPASEEKRRMMPFEVLDRKSSRFGSFDSYRSYESDSPVWSSEGSDRDRVSVISPLTVSTVRTKFPLTNGLSESDVLNGECGSVYNTTSSSMEDVSKEANRESVSSSKMDESQGQRPHELRWHCYQRPHRFRATFKPIRTLIPIEELSVGQMSVLKKLSVVKLTALIELYNYKSKSNITRMLKGKKIKIYDVKNKNSFGVPLSVNVRRTGQALPPVILYAMKHLREEGRLQTMGIFRRAASKARVDVLKELAEANPELSDFTDFSPYDIADMIKLYYRELPEPLLTSKLSEMLILVQENVPSQVRLPALQAVMLLMPDEHREALQVLLLFLKEVVDNVEVNQMTAQNLAVCFAPTLFSLCNSPLKPSGFVRMGSFKRNTMSVGLSPTQLASNKDVIDSVASSHCLTQMICHADKLFKVAADTLHVCRFTHLETGDPVPYYELGLDRKGNGNLNTFLDGCAYTVLREARKKFKAWIHHDTINGVDVSHLKPRDGVPLWVWRGMVELNASSAFVHQRLWSDRYLWDGKMTGCKLITKIDKQTEVFQYMSPSIPPLTERDHCLLRSWQYDVSSESYILMSMSVSHPSASLEGGIRAMQLANYYLVESLDKEKSRLSYLCRVDTRGRSYDYYNKAYGPYLAASTVSRIRDALRKDHGILETSV